MKHGILSKFSVLFLMVFIPTGCNQHTVNLEEPAGTPFVVSQVDQTGEESARRRSRRLDCQSLGEEKCDKTCQQRCQRLFPRATREKCYALPKSLVHDFSHIIKDVRKGEIENLNQPALQCLLEVDTGPFIQSIRAMSSGPAKDFLIEIAKDSELSALLRSADKQFKIIRELLKEAGQSQSLVDRLNTVLDLDEGQSFLWLLSDTQNKQAFSWLENYIEDYCSKSRTDCPHFDQIGVMGAFCQALLEVPHLKSFLVSADLFEERYKHRVEQKGYEYKITDDDYTWHETLKGDFRDFCQIETQITDGEKKMQRLQNQMKYFVEAECKEMLKPLDLTGSSSPPAVDDSTRKAFISADLNRFTSNQHVWNYGNLFGPHKLNGVGDILWYLDGDKKIITHKINTEFSVFIKRGQVLAPAEEIPLKDPKTESVRRSLFLSYVLNPNPQNRGIDPAFPACVGGVEADREKCLSAYCLLDYQLAEDHSVKTCSVLKCALHRPE